MKGYSHAITGAALWTAIASPTIHLQDLTTRHVHDIALNHPMVHVSPRTYALGLMLTAGSAMLCDSDHPKGTIAYSLPSVGPIPSPTKLMCESIGKISGGHRHGTHSILGIAIFTLIAYCATLLRFNVHGKELNIGAGIFAFFLTAFTLKVFRVGKSDAWLERWLGSLTFAAAMTWWFPTDWKILPLTVFLGCLVHCIGDSLTIGGVPWLYPLTPDSPKWIRHIPILKNMWQKNGWFAFPILGKTDSGQEKGPTREKVLCFLLSVYIIVIGMMTMMIDAKLNL